MSQTFETQRIIFKLQEFGQNMIIPFEQLTGARTEFRAIACDFASTAEMRILSYLAEHQIMDKKVTFPTTWWDAVKDRFCPKWARKYLSINFTAIEVKVTELATKWQVPKDYGPWPIMIWNQRQFKSPWSVAE